MPASPSVVLWILSKGNFMCSLCVFSKLSFFYLFRVSLRNLNLELMAHKEAVRKMRDSVVSDGLQIELTTRFGYTTWTHSNGEILVYFSVDFDVLGMQLK